MFKKQKTKKARVLQLKTNKLKKKKKKLRRRKKTRNRKRIYYKSPNPLPIKSKNNVGKIMFLLTNESFQPSLKDKLYFSILSSFALFVLLWKKAPGISAGAYTCKMILGQMEAI